MALKTWTYSGTVRRTGTTSTSYGRIDQTWDGLPENIRIKRIYWQWDVDRQKGSVYARWYAGVTGNLVSGNSGVNATGIQFDVTSITTLTGTSGTAQVYLGAQYGWADYSNITFNVEFDYLQSSFTLSTTNVEAGKTITANIAIQDPSATHRATWQFGTRTQAVSTAAGVASSSFTVPLAWLDQIPNAVSGLASCTLETLNSAGASVGSQVLYFNILAPSSVVPSITSLTATRVNNDVPSAWGVYVQDQSGVTVKGVASGAYGSTIASWAIAGDGKKANAATLSIDRISGSGTLTFKATVTDSRGRTATKTVSITVQPWSTPVVKGLDVIRATASGAADPTGASLYVSLSGSISSVSGKNTASVAVSYREQGASAWTSAATGTAASGSWTIAKDVADLTKAYEIRVILSDAFGSASATAICATAECFLDKMPGRKRLGVGGYNAEDNSVYINPEWGIHWGDKHITDSPRNLLDNSDFSNPVNQRGQTSYTGTAGMYGIDRWVQPNANIKVSVESGYISVYNGDTTSARTIQQRTTALAGYDGPITAAVCLSDGTILCGSCVNSSTATSGSQYLWTISGNDKNIGALWYDAEGYKSLGLNISAGTTVNILWAALYKGEYTIDTLPEYVPKGYGAEWRECQRYYKANPLKVIYDTTIEETGIAKINLTGLNLEYVHIMLSCTAFTAASGIHVYPYSGGKVVPVNTTSTAGSAFYVQDIVDRRQGALVVNNYGYTSATSIRTLSGAGFNYVKNVFDAGAATIERVLIEVHSGDLQFPVGSRILIMGIEGVIDL